jgi:hypothetical protein
MAPIVYFLGGVLVRATTKAIRDRLIAQGFRKATKGQIDSKIPTVTGTENNLISLITRAKNAIKSESPVASSGRNTPRRTNKLGGSGQSAIGRKLGSRRMANFGKVRGGKGRAESMAKTKPPTVKIKSKDKVNPSPKSTNKGVTTGATIAGLVAAGAIGKVAYDAYIRNNSPTVTQIKAAEKQIAAAAKDNRRQPSKEGSLVGDAGTQGSMQKARRIEAKKLEIKKRKAAELDAAKADAKRKDTPERKRRIDNTVRLAAIGGGAGLKKISEDADKKALTEVLNKKIASRKSTAAKEKAKARAGEYKSLASAKKAGSLYYMHKGKELRAAITAEETESAYKRIRGEAMKKIAEGK